MASHGVRGALPSVILCDCADDVADGQRPFRTVQQAPMGADWPTRHSQFFFLKSYICFVSHSATVCVFLPFDRIWFAVFVFWGQTRKLFGTDFVRSENIVRYDLSISFATQKSPIKFEIPTNEPQQFRRTTKRLFNTLVLSTKANV